MIGDHVHTGVRILIADDDPSCLAVYRLLLERSGFRVVTARDGGEAITLVEEAARMGREYDLLLLDIRMPVASGWEVLDRAVALTGPDRLPPRVILMTGFSVELDIHRVKTEGVAGVLIKPIPNRTLVDEVRRVLALHLQAAAELSRRVVER